MKDKPKVLRSVRMPDTADRAIRWIKRERKHKTYSDALIEALAPAIRNYNRNHNNKREK
jgi:hypothetical protein